MSFYGGVKCTATVLSVKCALCMLPVELCALNFFDPRPNHKLSLLISSLYGLSISPTSQSIIIVNHSYFNSKIRYNKQQNQTKQVSVLNNHLLRQRLLQWNSFLPVCLRWCLSLFLSVIKWHAFCHVFMHSEASHSFVFMLLRFCERLFKIIF